MNVNQDIHFANEADIKVKVGPFNQTTAGAIALHIEASDGKDTYDLAIHGDGIDRVTLEDHGVGCLREGVDSPADFREAMEKACKGDSMELRHLDADILMFKLLRKLGYGDAMDVFESTERGYK